MPDLQNLEGKRAEVGKKIKAHLDAYDPDSGKKWDSAAQDTYDTLTAEAESLAGQISALKNYQKDFLDTTLENKLDDLQDKGSSPKASKADQLSGIHAKWLRGGDSALNEADWTLLNTMSTTTPSEGGYTVPSTLSSDIIEQLKEFGAMRNVAEVMTTADGTTINWPTTDGTAEEGELVPENQSATDEDISFGTVALGMYKFSSKVITVPRELMQDTTIALESLVNRRLAERLGRITDRLFTNGTGTNQPRGIVPAVEATTTPVRTDAATDLTYNDLLALKHAIDPAYRNTGARFMFHDDILLYLKQNLKDLQGRPLWVPSYRVGEPDTIDGSPYTINQMMPGVTAGALTADQTTMLFGDLKKYIIRDCLAIELHRFTDSVYTKKFQVGFLAWMRTSGDLIDRGGAIQSLKQKSA